MRHDRLLAFVGGLIGGVLVVAGVVVLELQRSYHPTSRRSR